jgi:hypothetical protein
VKRLIFQMKDSDLEEFQDIEQRIRHSPNPYAGVAELAVAICRLIAEGRNKIEYQNYFNQIVDEYALEGAVSRHSRYAIRLMSSGVDMFEEIVKVFSLLEEVEALGRLGLNIDAVTAGKLQSTFQLWYEDHKLSIRKSMRGRRVDTWCRDCWFWRIIEAG